MAVDAGTEAAAVDRAIRRRSDAPRLWFLRLQRAASVGPATAGIAAGAVVLAATAAPLASHVGTPAQRADLTASAFFFALSIGFLTAATGWVFPAARGDLLALRPRLQLERAALLRVSRALVRLSPRTSWIMVLPALAFGGLHAWLLHEPDRPPTFAVANAGGTVALWLAMFQIAPPLVANARIFALLGALARPDLYHPRALEPFGNAALRPTVILIALQTFYPVLLLGDPDGLEATALVGLYVSVLLTVGLFFLPLRGIRRRLRGARDAAVDRLDARLTRLSSDAPPDAPTTPGPALTEAAALLALRERLRAAPTWPLGLDGLRRVMLYIVLPPLTWAAAALVQTLVETMV